MELTLSTNKNIENSLEKEQKKFINTTFGKVINTGLDIGLRTILPDLIEDEVIGVKNAILENGFKSGLETAISSSINLGKSAIGIFTGDFENIEQIQTAIGKGGILDSVSDLIDLSSKKAKEKGIISNTVLTAIKGSKNTIIKSIESNIENEFETQIKAVKKVSEYSEKWNNNFNEKNFDGMEKAIKNLKKYLKEIIPLESTLKEARTIENLHSLIKNKGGDFNLSEEELNLVEKLSK